MIDLLFNGKNQFLLKWRRMVVKRGVASANLYVLKTQGDVFENKKSVLIIVSLLASPLTFKESFVVVIFFG